MAVPSCGEYPLSRAESCKLLSCFPSYQTSKGSEIVNCMEKGLNTNFDEDHAYYIRVLAAYHSNTSLGFGLCVNLAKYSGPGFNIAR